MTSETAVVARRCRRNAEQILIVVNRLHDRGEEEEKLLVLRRVLTGL